MEVGITARRVKSPASTSIIAVHNSAHFNTYPEHIRVICVSYDRPGLASHCRFHRYAPALFLYDSRERVELFPVFTSICTFEKFCRIGSSIKSAIDSPDEPAKRYSRPCRDLTNEHLNPN